MPPDEEGRPGGHHHRNGSRTNPHHTDRVETESNGQGRQDHHGAALLSIPDLPDDVDNLTAALEYARRGFYVVPVHPADPKKPRRRRRQELGDQVQPRPRADHRVVRGDQLWDRAAYRAIRRCHIRRRRARQDARCHAPLPGRGAVPDRLAASCAPTVQGTDSHAPRPRTSSRAFVPRSRTHARHGPIAPAHSMLKTKSLDGRRLAAGRNRRVAAATNPKHFPPRPATKQAARHPSRTTGLPPSQPRCRVNSWFRTPGDSAIRPARRSLLCAQPHSPGG